MAASSWSAFRGDGNPGDGQVEFGANFSMIPSLPESAGGRGCDDAIRLEEIGVSPLDEHNTKLLDNVAPRDWKDPQRGKDFVYDLIAIGAGSGGLICAKQSARRGAKSALIEFHMAGGDCLNVGCVPSKALIRAARCCKEVRVHSAEMGIIVKGSEVDFGKIMERMRRLRAEISPADAYSTSTSAGTDCYQGKAKFTGKDTLEVNGQTLRFRKAVVATGGSAALPNIPGLTSVPYTTNSSLYNLTELPPRVVVVGGGPIGLEMAQCLSIFGSKVTVALRGPKILPKEDPDAAKIVADQLVKDGIQIAYNCSFQKIEHTPAKKGSTFPEIRVIVDREGKQETLACEVLLMATGRKPNVQGIGLDEAGVEFDTSCGVKVDEFLCTSNPNIFAAGDVCTQLQFTHVSGAMAQIVVQNALFGGRRTFNQMLVPWATFTEPEVAHTGLYECDFAKRGLECDTYRADLEHVDRAILESEKEGFVKVHCLKGTDEILGATIVGPAAGDMISEITVAMHGRIGLGTLGRIIHPYPTIAEAIQGCGIQYNRTQWATMGDTTSKKLKREAEDVKLSLFSPQVLPVVTAVVAAGMTMFLKRGR